ncbi:serine/threonine protein phosphatase [Salipiger sp. IMCC34102]|uniref:metallophosphoesterase family protein n=1 Tax=Salipiger sp. IMCC34102 TaxID=2510647 RepID=UPI00101D9EFD|nr:metallophosphoesterase family protein [Salipiger sp. IMCC34102]RYH00681.1 serine/threonine protein phosphatase [Salipiger sp. IMCC34102]
MDARRQLPVDRSIKMQTVSLGARPLPGSPRPNREIFAIGDVHGQADVLRAVLTEIANTPVPPGTKRILIFLGDLIDRGPDSIGAVSTALKTQEAIGADRMVLLPGNHELFLLDVLKGEDPALWVSNGGRAVMEEVDPSWAELPWPVARDKLVAALPHAWIQSIKAAPSHVTMGDLLFVHAGLDPQADRETFLERHRPTDDLHWAWIRNEFLMWDKGWDRTADGEPVLGPTVVVHGHTPAIRTLLSKTQAELPLMDAVDTHRAICLDAGAASRPQIGWARFWTEGDRGVVDIKATFEEG